MARGVGNNWGNLGEVWGGFGALSDSLDMFSERFGAYRAILEK